MEDLTGVTELNHGHVRWQLGMIYTSLSDVGGTNEPDARYESLFRVHVFRTAMRMLGYSAVDSDIRIPYPPDVVQFLKDVAIGICRNFYYPVGPYLEQVGRIELIGILGAQAIEQRVHGDPRVPSAFLQNSYERSMASLN